MVKLILMVVFMIPLSFFRSYYWMIQSLFFFMFFTFFINFGGIDLWGSISMGLGCDLLSFLMVWLSLWICSLMIMASEKIFYKNIYVEFFLLVMLFLLLFLYVAFSAMNLFMFYLFFEASLIPTLILIMGWGYQPERIQAGVYLLFYTMFASLPMLLVILYLYKYNSTLEFSLLGGNYGIFMYLCMNMVFFVKMPMYFLHLWLPKAHVEAPVSGSMILAGIMLKLGGYGLMRMMLMFLEVGMRINLIFIIISMVGGIWVSFICMRQSDMKSLIAYSSVSHMGMVMGGIMSLNYWGFSGALMMMIAHGLCSSGLFCLANISYERLHSRSLFLNKGLINLMPSLSLWWFLLSSSNMAAPPSLNLLGEIFLINSLIGWSWLLMLTLMFLSFFSAVYSLYLYSFSQHGKISMGLYSFSLGNVREYLLLFLHWFPLNLLVLKLDYFSLWV
uniref:NADH-ubiquinone oxidoreductase chain 4 n=1 Tax=Ptilodactylidae sp. 2 ACP-2013 TaxID=1434563 RepID=A0A3G5FNP0_9COLE|nr:NADH dehydrogenase subunit 4 [Ptilodactylidae sp. 2 ACP-2013]